MCWQDWPPGAERGTDDVYDDSPLVGSPFVKGTYVERKCKGACVNCGKVLPMEREFVHCSLCRERLDAYKK